MEQELLDRKDYNEAVAALSFVYGVTGTIPAANKARTELLACYLASRVAASTVKCKTSKSTVSGLWGNQLMQKTRNYARTYWKLAPPRSRPNCAYCLIFVLLFPERFSPDFVSTSSAILYRPLADCLPQGTCSSRS